MALSIAVTREELARLAASSYSGVTFTMALAYHVVPPEVEDGICAWLARELTNASGYARVPVTVTGDGFFSADQGGGWEFEPQSLTFSAVSRSLIYTHAILLAGAPARGVCGPLDAPSVVNPEDNSIQLSSHGLQTGKKVTVRAEDGTLPGGLAAGSPYYVSVLDPDAIRLSTTPDGLSIVNITDAGLGGLCLIDCTGSVHSVWSEGQSRTLLKNASITYHWTPSIRA